MVFDDFSQALLPFAATSPSLLRDLFLDLLLHSEEQSLSGL